MIVLFLYLVIFLFCLHALCKDDLVLLRKNMPIEKIFNFAFILIAIGLFFARLGYVIFHFTKLYLSPLVFLNIWTFPGLLLSFGIVGSSLYGIISLRSQKLPIGHILDCFSLSLLISLPFGLFFNFLNSKHVLKEITSFFLFLEILMYIILFFILLRIFQGARLKEGSVSLLFLAFYSVASFLTNLFGSIHHKLSVLFAGENIITLGILFVSLFLLLLSEGIFKTLHNTIQKVISAKRNSSLF